MADENDFNMQSVDSDLLSQVGFNSTTGHGRAMFAKNGKVYGYPGCTQDEYESILRGDIAGSVGKTFNQLWKWKPGYCQVS
jgi:hypothetical protein